MAGEASAGCVPTGIDSPAPPALPPGNGPLAVVGMANSQPVAATHQALDVVRAEATVAFRHPIDELLHLEAGIDVALCPMELYGAIGEEFTLPL